MLHEALVGLVDIVLREILNVARDEAAGPIKINRLISHARNQRVIVVE